MPPRARLREFLADRFSDTEFRTFINDYFEAASDSIAWTEGLDKQTDEFVSWVQSHDQLAALFTALREQRPTFADELAKIERDWSAAKPSALTRWIPNALRTSRPLQIGLGGVVVGAVVVIAMLVLRTPPTTAVVILDANARALVGSGPSLFTIEIEGEPHELSARGVAIGTDEMHADIARAYRKEIGRSTTPDRVEKAPTAKLVATIRVMYDGKPCKTPLVIRANENQLYVVKDLECRDLSGIGIHRPPPNSALPKIGIAIQIERSEDFLTRFKNDLRNDPAATSVEDFLTQRLIDVFSRIPMFQFVPAGADIPAASTLVVRIETLWPRSPVEMRMKLGDELVQRLTVFNGPGCGTEPCFPASFIKPEWYEAVFAKFLAQWPAGFLKSIPLTTTAIYEANGIVRTDEDLATFGQPDGGPPKAIFEIMYGPDKVQRPFVLCQTRTTETRKGVGRDTSVNDPNCWDQPANRSPAGVNGRVTLVKVLP